MEIFSEDDDIRLDSMFTITRDDVAASYHRLLDSLIRPPRSASTGRAGTSPSCLGVSGDLELEVSPLHHAHASMTDLAAAAAARPAAPHAHASMTDLGAAGPAGPAAHRRRSAESPFASERGGAPDILRPAGRPQGGGRIAAFDVPNERGYALRCFLHRPPAAADAAPGDATKRWPVLVYVHDHGGSADDAAHLAAHVVAAGRHAVCCFDCTASGASDGVYASLGYYERNDVAHVLAALAARPDVDASGLTLFGCGVGAAAVMTYVSEPNYIAFAGSKRTAHRRVYETKPFPRGTTGAALAASVKFSKVRLQYKKYVVEWLDRFGPLARAGVARGDVLIGVGEDQLRPSSLEGLRALLAKTKRHDRIQFYRNVRPVRPLHLGYTHVNAVVLESAFNSVADLVRAVSSTVGAEDSASVSGFGSAALLQANVERWLRGSVRKRLHFDLADLNPGKRCAKKKHVPPALFLVTGQNPSIAPPLSEAAYGRYGDAGASASGRFTLSRRRRKRDGTDKAVLDLSSLEKTGGLKALHRAVGEAVLEFLARVGGPDDDDGEELCASVMVVEGGIRVVEDDLNRPS